MSPAAPTKEIGQATLQAQIPGWSSLIGAVDEREYAPDVTWPTSVQTFERMETDAQVRGLLLGMFLPIRRFRWMLDPNGASDEVVTHIARDFNLPIKGEDAPPPVPRSAARNRFSHDRHLSHTLRALVYGHYFFEQVGVIGDDGRWHLTKLAPRPPYTIAQGGRIDVAPDGGLKGIVQGTGLLRQEIPVSRLVAYVWDQEGGNWFGRSLLRACFKNWAIKDRLLRVDATNHERNGSGVPWFEVDSSLSQPQIDRLAETAQRIRSGDTAGGAGPGKLAIKGVEGSLPDTIKSIEYHDKQMTMATLELFTDLGRNTTAGTQALGGTLMDWFGFAQEAIADWHAGITTEHAIWDDVDYNFPIDESAPALIYDRSSQEDLPVADLTTLVDKGVITIDPALEDALREKYNLPDRADPAAPTPAPTPVAARKPTRAAVVGHRDPTEVEVRAATDFASMQADYTSERDQLVADVAAVQADQRDQLRQQIEAADGNLAALSALTVTPLAAKAIATAAKRIARRGVDQVTAEAGAQGVTATEPDLAAIDTAMDARAAAVDKTLADALAQSARQKAVALSGGGLTATAVADAVDAHLQSLSTAYLEEQLGGVVTQAQNTGRKETMRATPPKNVYASELLDDNTCGPCSDEDGTEWSTVEQAELDYSVGGFNECEGGLRCRGTLVAIYS